MSWAKPKEKVRICVDNSVAFAYLNRGGGRLPHFNRWMRPFWRWVMENEVQLDVKLVKSAEDLADPISRMEQDHGDYTLNRELFNFLSQKFEAIFRPEVDMFASPGNCQLEKFVSRFPHHQAVGVDALKCPLVHKNCYANPPWNLVGQWLTRLWENLQVTCLTVIPLWDSAPWWPLVQKLHFPGSPVFKIDPFWGMFQNCWGEEMPPPRWHLLCILLSGKHWKLRKWKLKMSTIGFENLQV